MLARVRGVPKWRACGSLVFNSHTTDSERKGREEKVVHGSDKIVVVMTYIVPSLFTCSDGVVQA